MAKDGLLHITKQLTVWWSSALHSPAQFASGFKWQETFQCCLHGAHFYCNPVDYSHRYLYVYLKDVYICKYEQKVAIILGAVQLLMLTDWGCHFIWRVPVCACVCEREIWLLFIHLWICAIRKFHLNLEKNHDSIHCCCSKWYIYNSMQRSL